METKKAPEDLLLPTEVAEPVAPVDLSSLDSIEAANKGAPVELYSPITGKDLNIRVFLVGRDSDTFKEASTEQNRRRIQKMSKGGFRPGNAPIDDSDKEGIALLAACTTGWENMLLEGKQVPFSRKAAIDIYTRFPWIKEQIDNAVGDRALFMKASQPS